MRDVNYRRRQFLQRGVAVGSVFLPVPYAGVWAQSDGVLKLLRLPKVALVLQKGAGLEKFGERRDRLQDLP